ncbi:hypothetical protein HYT52_03420 [Candidatus Woesearchaeota archaeon]|nr:hypothetical protein [Candidatus Woesearchaeota archaeon]
MSLTKILLLDDKDTAILADKLAGLLTGLQIPELRTERGNVADPRLLTTFRNSQYDLVLVPAVVDIEGSIDLQQIRERHPGLIAGYGLTPSSTSRYDGFLDTPELMRSENRSVYLKEWLDSLRPRYLN